MEKKNPSSGDINRLMMMIICLLIKRLGKVPKAPLLLGG
jgi:hypothetical protein